MIADGDDPQLDQLLNLSFDDTRAVVVYTANTPEREGGLYLQTSLGPELLLSCKMEPKLTPGSRISGWSRTTTTTTTRARGDRVAAGATNERTNGGQQEYYDNCTAAASAACGGGEPGLAPEQSAASVRPSSAPKAVKFRRKPFFRSCSGTSRTDVWLQTSAREEEEGGCFARAVLLTQILLGRDFDGGVGVALAGLREHRTAGARATLFILQAKLFFPPKCPCEGGEGGGGGRHGLIQVRATVAAAAAFVVVVVREPVAAVVVIVPAAAAAPRVYP